MMKLSTFNILLFVLTFSNAAFNITAQAESIKNQNLTKTKNVVKANGKYITLLGSQVTIDQQAPNFKVVDKNFAPVQLSDFSGQTVLISVVPSVDTGVCSLQTKRFNEESTKLPNNITVMTISNDLPFAQKRFCKVEEVDKINILSDSVWHHFGESYGLIIKNMGLLTRAVFIIDSQGKLKYKELVANISQHPDYDKALAAVKNIAAGSVENQRTKEQVIEHVVIEQKAEK